LALGALQSDGTLELEGADDKASFFNSDAPILNLLKTDNHNSASPR
jgi:hypothetical protein